MSKKKTKREPLLYIHQPDFTVIAGKMQESYSLKEAEKTKSPMPKQSVVEESEVAVEEQRKSIGMTKVVPDEVALTPEEVQKTVEAYDQNAEQEAEKREYGMRRLKSFREMDIEERLVYLLHFPKQLPPVPCRFQTEKKEWRGILIEKTDEQIVLKLFDQSEITIPIQDLIAVRMIGLN